MSSKSRYDTGGTIPMKRTSMTGLLLILGFFAATSQTTQDTLFYRSLHYTARGMSYWYASANGGLESITGVPYEQLGCQNCHVAGCFQCHLTVANDQSAYSTAAARRQEQCLVCHAREASIMKIDRESNQSDVHVEKGMICMDCHTAREIHGDGREYVSMKQPDAMEVSCGQCHSPGESRAHTVHDGKLDCNACHQRHVVSCTNCHFETLVKEGKRIAIPVSGWMFLMNLNGKVTSATMQSFVVKENKTFLMFAPQHSHSVMGKGRTCNECHSAKILEDIRKGRVKLTWFQDAKMQNRKGVIPVAEGITWEMVYQDREGGNWVPMANPRQPKLHYASFGTPLTAAQIRSLRKPQTDTGK